MALVVHLGVLLAPQSIPQVGILEVPLGVIVNAYELGIRLYHGAVPQHVPVAVVPLGIGQLDPVAPVAITAPHIGGTTLHPETGDDGFVIHFLLGEGIEALILAPLKVSSTARRVHPLPELADMDSIHTLGLGNAELRVELFLGAEGLEHLEAVLA